MQKKWQSHNAKLTRCKKLSTGVLASNGVHSLNDPRFLENHHKRLKESNNKEDRVSADRRTKLKKRIGNVKVLCDTHGHERTHLFSQFNLTQCAMYLQYKKKSHKDGKMPEELSDGQKCCVEWIARSSLTASPHASDDEDDRDIKGSATADLMGLADDTDGGIFDDVMGSEGVDVDADCGLFVDTMGNEGVGMDTNGQLDAA